MTAGVLGGAEDALPAALMAAAASVSKKPVPHVQPPPPDVPSAPLVVEPNGHDEHDVAPVIAENVSAGQLLHSAAPAADAKVPAGQAAQAPGP
jgi:hypothetical protein